VGPNTSYSIPEFYTYPTGSESSIIYSDVSTFLPTSVTFDNTTRTYSWSAITPVGTYYLEIQGTLPFSSPRIDRFNLTVTPATMIPSVCVN
jgi:hypothetical protein